MSAFPNVNPVTHLNGHGLVNPDSSGVGSFLFTNTRIPNGPHTLPPPGNNVQSAASIYPGGQNGGKRIRKINRKKINKISRKYKMRGSRRTVRRHVRRMKSRVRSRYSGSRKMRTKRRQMRGGTSSRSMSEGARPPMRGGAFQQPMTAPNYPNGHTQYQNNNGSLSNTYSTGGVLPASLSALASPVPYQHVAGDVDNLNHNTLNSYGNIGAGSGFASRGWI